MPPRSVFPAITAATLAQDALRQRAGLRRVTCDLEQGALVLRGRVHNYFLRQLAAACAARAVDRSLPVVDRLQVG